jgi:hypothetical protein
MSTIKNTEIKFREALNRLLAGEPIRTKSTGKLTFNKINNEAGAGHSYINKACFKSLREEEFQTQIERYNNVKFDAMEGGVILPELNLSTEDALRRDLKREIGLKVRYKKERDDARKYSKLDESERNTLLFRIHDLQEQLRPLTVVSINK